MVEYSLGYSINFLFVSLNFNTRVSNDRKYVCGRGLYACINTRKFKGLDSREITSLQGKKGSDLHGTSFQSSPKINRTRLIFAYNESLQHPTIAGLLIKILLFLVFDRYSAHLFQSNRVESDRIRGPTCSGKALNFIFPKLSSQNVRGLGHPTILIPSFHGLH